MKLEKPKRPVWVVETKPADDLNANFRPATTELYLKKAERVAEELAKEDDNLMVRIIEKKLVWRNY